MRKSVLITGGNKGIGLETTRLFVASGYDVFVLARDFADFPFASAVTPIEFDLREIAKLPEIVREIGHVDVLVNNAGVMFASSYDQYTEEKVRTTLQLNLEAPIALIRECSRSMVAKGSGRIVNLSSVAGQAGHPDVWYGASKAGILNATKSFAEILGPKGIVVNAVAPGPTDTEMLETIPKERKDAFLPRTILGRFGKAKEIAQVVHWLGTDSPEYMNGVCLDMNNGVLPR